MNSLLKLRFLLAAGLLANLLVAATPDTLTLNDLRNNPERWPASVAVARELKFQGGGVVRPGQLVRVVEINGSEVVVDDGKGLVFGLAADQTDLVARANEVWLKLTPEQRGITAATLRQDRALWPTKVRSFGEFGLTDGTVIRPGGEFELLAVDRDGVKLYAPEYNTTLTIDVSSTDLVERARALALVPAAQRPSRVAAALRGTLVDAGGKPAEPDNLEETQVFALYYGASWCAPCRKFSPELVKFVKREGPLNPRLTVVLMSNDKSDAAMYGYMREEGMPWVAMPLEKLNRRPSLTAYVKGGIPQLVIVDRQGKVLADSYRGSTYLGPLAAMQQLERILATGAAR